MSSILNERKLLASLFDHIQTFIDDDEDPDLQQFNDIMKHISTPIPTNDNSILLSDLCKDLILKMKSIYKIKNIIYILDKTNLIHNFLRVHLDEFDPDKVIQII